MEERTIDSLKNRKVLLTKEAELTKKRVAECYLAYASIVQHPRTPSAIGGDAAFANYNVAYSHYIKAKEELDFVNDLLDTWDQSGD